MSERSTIRAVRRPNTVESLRRELYELGVREGDILLVHSSLSRLGWVCGASPAVLEALRRAVGAGGTLVMPAHTGALSDPAQWKHPPVPRDWLDEIYRSMPAFDPLVTPSQGMGRIAELFRTLPGTLRSGHPQVSFCANGRAAAHIVARHPLTPQFGMDSPLGALYRMGAKVLLLGVGYANCTCLHLAETLCPKMFRAKMGAPLLVDGRREWVWFEDFDYDVIDFEALGRAFDREGDVTAGKIGAAACRLFDLRQSVDFARGWFEENRFFSGRS